MNQRHDETNLLDEVGGLLDDLVEAVLGPLSSVHLVNGDNELLHTEGVCEKSVLTSLAVLGDTSLELTSTGGNDENSAVSLGSTSDHVLDEVTVTRSVNDGDVVARGLELPESDVDGDTALTLGLQLVQNPCVLEGTLAEFSGFLFEMSVFENFDLKRKNCENATIAHERLTFSNFSMVRLSIPPHL